MRASRLSHTVPWGLVLSVLSIPCTACWDAETSLRSARRPNQAPLGAIDGPNDAATVPTSFNVTGWAGDDRGILVIRVLVDGKLAAIASFVAERPDVTKVHPQLRHGTDRHGWEATVEAGEPGSHEVRVEAVDSDGVTSDLGARQITVGAR